MFIFCATLTLASSLITLKFSKETNATEFGGKGSFISVDINNGETRYTVTTDAIRITTRYEIFLSFLFPVFFTKR
ncbi:exported protein of unknown function [Candidatus Nitrosocosmicus franklandus]|uniref:Uncharacterized protein n=1 Tax=Candidatus Nitrosocosmicus franklandianus TaxID=1798806 RepID=A0A484I8H5_9ARCH|nr:exported protein of unknown function [Candidatus Nitrosocosmicus franklandus]